MTVSRRRFLSGAAVGAAGTALTAGVLVEGARVDAAAAGGHATPAPVFPFHGEHQSGILTPAPADKQSASCFAAFDVTAANRAELTELMKTLTGRARVLTAGGPAPDLGVGEPPADSAVLGPDIPADGLTVTTGVGASLFDQRFGLADRKPAHLTPMRTFPDDSPDPAWMHGDLLIQLCAHNPDTVHHAIRDITRHTRGALQLRWKIQGYNSPSRPSGTGRNLLGFKDGTANPVGSSASELIWVDSADEPAWTKGGTYQVVRLIRMLVEFWDRVSIAEQENMFGRRRESGAPLDGNKETDTPNYAADPDATVTPANAHIRLANPRTPETANQQLLRRSYNYDLGIDPNGNMSAGHIFTCFQQDIQRQFETIQTRLAGEPLTDYVQPFGGGYFFTLPGVRDAGDWYARGLLS
ncbi:iron uptake transporter deferrochelatase/peroxidase subunit [Nocardia sp. CDC153]|uniref:iron uptake transporter deferrochelatase/peroxidase subunit n=1 Tax=Nocardia sp. CDC153 TaxID=3112167 RepID=UPI002DBD0881|nr:iron uptake transporter deferrochelatase/peroxidase subunit [Nocardia sp. CDC153]MEC3956941.1 iron uptake transporter deferrochelatase/peroxidase subunit [Nocardia sp. CDC153]